MPSFQLSPGTVVDPDRQEAYLMSPEGGIVAVGLADGAAVWHSREADKPLTVAGELLVGQGQKPDSANTLRIVTMDPGRDGAQVNETLVELPPDVQPSTEASLGRSFTAEAVPEATEAVVSWEYVERPLRGLPPGPVEVLPGEVPPAVSAAAPPAAESGAVAPTDAPAAEPGGGMTVVRGTVRVDLSSGIASAAEQTRVAAAPGPPPGAAGESASAPDLPPTSALPGVPEPQFLSADGRHVLSSQRIADDPEWDKYLWTIVDRDTGRQVGEFRMHLRYVPFFVSGTRVIYQTPPYERREGTQLRQEPVRLRAADLSSGNPVWQLEVRDTLDREPLPP